jgi:hypothetical protein
MAKHDGRNKRTKKSAGVAGTIKSAVAALGSGVEGAASQVAHRRDEHPSGHAPAKAHGHATTVDDSLPVSRAELLDLHTEARRKRAAAPLASDAYRDAADEIGRIEVRIAAVERAMTPPKG